LRKISKISRSPHGFGDGKFAGMRFDPRDFYLTCNKVKPVIAFDIDAHPLEIFRHISLMNIFGERPLRLTFSLDNDVIREGNRSVFPYYLLPSIEPRSLKKIEFEFVTLAKFKPSSIDVRLSGCGESICRKSDSCCGRIRIQTGAARNYRADENDKIERDSATCE